MNIKIGLWPLSGNYGQIFSQKYLDEYVEKAVALGFKNFDNAESYGEETFQREFCEVLCSKKTVRVDTKIRVDFSQERWLKQLQHDLEKVYNKYGDKLNCVFLHNPRGTLKQTVLAIETIIEYCEVTGRRSGVSLLKDDYENIDNFPVNVFQVDLNPTFNSKINQIISAINPDKIEARSLFGSGLLVSNIKNLAQEDQRQRWSTPSRLNAGVIFKRRALTHLKNEDALTLALIKFPALWKIKNVVLGSTNVKRLKLWQDASGTTETLDDIKIADLLKKIGRGLYCF